MKQMLAFRFVSYWLGCSEFTYGTDATNVNCVTNGSFEIVGQSLFSYFQLDGTYPVARRRLLHRAHDKIPSQIPRNAPPQNLQARCLFTTLLFRWNRRFDIAAIETS